MDGRKGGWEKAMEQLERAMRKELRNEAKDIGISTKQYRAMWKASYALLSELCEPTPKLVKDSIRMVGNFARLVEHCRLIERECYVEEKIEARHQVGCEGVIATSISAVSKEAESPPSPAKLPSISPIKAIVRWFWGITERFYICE